MLNISLKDEAKKTMTGRFIRSMEKEWYEYFKHKPQFIHPSINHKRFLAFVYV